MAQPQQEEVVVEVEVVEEGRSYIIMRKRMSCGRNELCPRRNWLEMMIGIL